MVRMVLVLMVALAAATPAGAADITGHPAVVDGDTLRFGRRLVRLWGVDAPERDQHCVVDGADMPIGQAAEMVLRSLIRDDTVTCTAPPTGADHDQYGRTVAVCRVVGLDLASLMVQAGWAWDYRRYSGGRYAAEQAAAQAQRQGVWGGDCTPPWAWRHRRRR